MNKPLKALYSKRLMKIMENYRTGVVFDLGVRLKPMDIIEEEEELIIICNNLDHAIILDKKLFLRKWENKR